MIFKFAIDDLAFASAEAFDPGIVAKAFPSDFVPEALAAGVVAVAFVPDDIPEVFPPDAASVTITITPAPMSVSPVAASRIYPLTVHLFCAERLTAKKAVNAANVNFRIKSYLFKDSLSSNPPHYNQSTPCPILQTVRKVLARLKYSVPLYKARSGFSILTEEYLTFQTVSPTQSCTPPQASNGKAKQ